MYPDVIPNPFDIILWNAKDVYQNVQAALFHTVKENGDHTGQVKKKKSFMIIFFSCFGLQPMVTIHITDSQTLLLLIIKLEINTFIQQWCIKLIKSDCKDLIIFLFQIKAVHFINQNSEKNIMLSTTIFNTDNNKTKSAY